MVPWKTLNRGLTVLQMIEDWRWWSHTRTEKWSYLGVDLVSHPNFNCCIEQKIRKFYRSMNSILRVEGRSNDTMMLKLLESHCLPILTYAIETITVCDRDKRRQLRVAYNSIFRRIFGYRNYESVSALQSFLGRPDWEGLVEKRTKTFLENVCKGTTLNIFIWICSLYFFPPCMIFVMFLQSSLWINRIYT